MRLHRRRSLRLNSSLVEPNDFPHNAHQAERSASHGVAPPVQFSTDRRTGACDTHRLIEDRNFRPGSSDVVH